MKVRIYREKLTTSDYWVKIQSLQERPYKSASMQRSCGHLYGDQDSRVTYHMTWAPSSDTSTAISTRSPTNTCWSSRGVTIRIGGSVGHSGDWKSVVSGSLQNPNPQAQVQIPASPLTKTSVTHFSSATATS